MLNYKSSNYETRKNIVKIVPKCPKSHNQPAMKGVNKVISHMA